MRKQFLFLMVSFMLIMQSCSNDEQLNQNVNSTNVISKFKTQNQNEIDNLKEYLETNQIFNQYASVDDLLFEHVDVNKEDSINVYSIIAVKNNVVDGVLLAFRIPENILESFPNGDKYALLYHKLVDFDLYETTGLVHSYDLNYNKKFMIRTFDKNEFVSMESFPILNITNSTPSNIEYDCNGGADGNVSWGECYRCLRGACDSDPSCKQMSDIVDYISTRFGIRGVLLISSMSMGAACVAISAIY